METEFEAGVWEQGAGFVQWSIHATEANALKAARRYARERTGRTGGALSWAGGVRNQLGGVTWVDRNGNILD